MEQTIQHIIEELLQQISIQSTVEVTLDGETFNVLLNSEENALLIGKHGNTLSSLESIIGLIVAQKTGEFKRIVIEVGGYRKEREEYLKDLTDRLSEEVASSGLEKRISGLKAWERRFVHMQLAEHPEVETESIGEDRERVLIIRKK